MTNPTSLETTLALTITPENAELGALPEEQEFIATMSPDVVLELIALARKNG